MRNTQGFPPDPGLVSLWGWVVFVGLVSFMGLGGFCGFSEFVGLGCVGLLVMVASSNQNPLRNSRIRSPHSVP